MSRAKPLRCGESLVRTTIYAACKIVAATLSSYSAETKDISITGRGRTGGEKGGGA